MMSNDVIDFLDEAIRAGKYPEPYVVNEKGYPRTAPDNIPGSIADIEGRVFRDSSDDRLYYASNVEEELQWKSVHLAHGVSEEVKSQYLEANLMLHVKQRSNYE